MRRVPSVRSAPSTTAIASPVVSRVASDTSAPFSRMRPGASSGSSTAPETGTSRPPCARSDSRSIACPKVVPRGSSWGASPTGILIGSGAGGSTGSHAGRIATHSTDATPHRAERRDLPAMGALMVPRASRRPWDDGSVEHQPASSRTGAVLRVVDVFALIAFVLVGIRSHHESGAAALFLRSAVPLLVAWFVVAVAVGTYRRPTTRTLLITWALAMPVGLIARSLIVGSPTGGRLVTFLGVGLAFTLLFLVVGRVLLGGPRAPGAPRRPPNVIR